jgi:hypothetical protein
MATRRTANMRRLEKIVDRKLARVVLDEDGID